MLIQFTFKNFKSFRDENTLFMTATDTNDICELYSRVGQYKLLPVTGIFGANASGKSNVLEAFEYMHNYIINSYNIFAEKTEFATDFSQKPFILDDTSENTPSFFEAEYIDKKDKYKTYRYGFTILKNTVIEEWLKYKSKTGKDYKTIFKRTNTKDIDLSGIKKEHQNNINIAIKPQVLILSIGAILNVPELLNVYYWFIRNKFINFSEYKLTNTNIIFNLLQTEDYKKSLLKYISSFDSSIIGIEADKDSKEIYTVHKKAGSEETVRFLYNMESAGTKKMIDLHIKFKNVLDSGNVLYIDELNAKLHPLLMRNILILFYNKETNPNNAQLIFTSHDAWMINNKSLRNDEIWFTEKDSNGISSLYSLDEFKVSDNPDIDFEKYYLVGKFGAIPDLKPIHLTEDKQ